MTIDWLRKTRRRLIVLAMILALSLAQVGLHGREPWFEKAFGIRVPTPVIVM